MLVWIVDSLNYDPLLAAMPQIDIILAYSNKLSGREQGMVAHRWANSWERSPDAAATRRAAKGEQQGLIGAMPRASRRLWPEGVTSVRGATSSRPTQRMHHPRWYPTPTSPVLASASVDWTMPDFIAVAQARK